MTIKKRKIPRPVHFETTVPVVRQHSCGVWLAAGVAEGIKAEIELVCLDTIQRLWCITENIEMYAMRRSGLIQMDPRRLSDPKFTTLFPQHYCSIRWPNPPPGVVQRSRLEDIPPY